MIFKHALSMSALLLCLLAGCDDGSNAVRAQHAARMRAERDARIQAQRREADAVQAASAQQEKKEFWQLTASGLAVIAVVLLVVGVGVGSVTKHDESES
jgi:heme/copper-type cytochrome/quinol oxidase subunit 2